MLDLQVVVRDSWWRRTGEPHIDTEGAPVFRPACRRVRRPVRAASDVRAECPRTDVRSWMHDTGMAWGCGFPRPARVGTVLAISISKASFPAPKESRHEIRDLDAAEPVHRMPADLRDDRRWHAAGVSGP